MSATIGKRWPVSRPYGDYPVECAYCGVTWPRSKCYLDADGNMVCPDDAGGQCQGELDRGNLVGRQVAAARSGRRGRAPDGIVRLPIEVLQVEIDSPEDGDEYTTSDTLTATGTCTDLLSGSAAFTEIRCSFAHPRFEPGRWYLGTTTPSSGAWSFSVSLSPYAGARTLWAYGVRGSRFVIAKPVRIVVT